METELSVWHLIANAGVLVQLVMLLLVAASVMSWALIFQRLQVFRKAKRAQLAFEERFWSGFWQNCCTAADNRNSGLPKDL